MTHPKICLHQTVHNRPEYTEISIVSIAERTLYPNFEWTVSNIASDAPTADLLDKLSDRYGFTLVHHINNIGQWAASQKAWETSDAPLLSKIDNDIIVPVGWLTALELAYRTFHPFLIGAYHFGINHFPKLDSLLPNGLGIAYINHIGGTSFLMSRTDWIIQGKIKTDHPIFGFTAYQAQAASRGAKIGYAYPPVKIIHMDEGEYPYSLRETTYKAETDRVYFLRHGKHRKGKEWP